MYDPYCTGDDKMYWIEVYRLVGKLYKKLKEPELVSKP